MIRAVFFDLYNTVGRFDPPREVIQEQALARFGLSVDREALLRAYPIADDFMAEENQLQPLRERSGEERAGFFARYQRLLLHYADLEVSEEVAGRIFEQVRALRQGFALFDDVIPTMAVLKEEGYILGLLSNIDEDIDKMSEALGLVSYLDFAVSSRQVGAPKPDPAFFREALKRAGVQPAEAVHVGDQYRNDVEGARGVGISPILLDREGHSSAPHDCPRISTLTELAPLVQEMARGGADISPQGRVTGDG